MVNSQNNVIHINGSVNQNNSLLGDINNHHCLSGNLGKVVISKDKELIFKNYQQFPAIGTADLLYIATDDNSIYRFDEDTLTYMCVGRDYKEIDTIQSIL